MEHNRYSLDPQDKSLVIKRIAGTWHIGIDGVSIIEAKNVELTLKSDEHRFTLYINCDYSNSPLKGSGD